MPLLVQAPAATRCMEVDDLLALASEQALEHRHAALRHLARRAIRLTPAVDGVACAARLGSAANDSHGDADWMRVAEIELSHPVCVGTALPPRGRLTVSVVRPSHRAGREWSMAQARVERDTSVTGGGLAAQLSAELVLPRVWAAAVQALELDEDEHPAYVRLRQRVAELQGVTAEDGGGHGVAHHHLLGYPTETSGSMPRVCELAARGLNPDEPPPDRGGDVAANSNCWRLLLQVTNDMQSGVGLGAGVERAYFWIAQEDLETQDFSRVWAILR